MKHPNHTYKMTWQKIITGVLIMVLLIASIPIGTVQAVNLNQEGTPPIPPGNEGKGSAFLERALQREQKTNENLVSLFDKADKVMLKLKEAIRNGKTNAKDVSALADVLENLTDQITSARAAHDKATSLLNNHAGFTENGKVMDATIAAGTIREIGRNHREARRLIGDVLKDTLRAIRGCRQDNRAK